jgi:ferredoxin
MQNGTAACGECALQVRWPSVLQHLSPVHLEVGVKGCKSSSMSCRHDMSGGAVDTHGQHAGSSLAHAAVYIYNKHMKHTAPFVCRIGACTACRDWDLLTTV